MDFLKKISKLIRGINSGVRIEEPKPFQKKYEVNSPTVWFTDSDIEQCLNAVAKLKIKHIHLQTTSTLEFLKDQRLQTVKGIDIQYPQKDIEPLLGLSRLTHLGLPDDIKGTFDFNLFPNLIYLAGQLPKKYVNFECLKNLRHAYLFGYRKKDFSDFSQFTNLKTLEIISANIVDLKGISKLSSLSELILNKCPKLESLDGLSKEQGSLNKIMIENTKRLKDISALGNLPCLKTLWLFKIPQINSFNVLKDLNQLESIRIYPNVVGVVNDDYYPLIDKFKELNQLEDIKHWSKLNAYLDGSFIPTSSTADEETELKQILANSNIMSWTEKLENGLDIYTEDNCAKAQSILSNLVRQLENNPDSSTVTKIDCIKTAVLEFNGLDDELEGFIETGEREDLCEIFDNIADVVGIDVQDYEDGIASEWRAW